MSRPGEHGMSLRFDGRHQIVPGLDERIGALSLQLPGQLAGVNAAAGETLQYGLTVPAIGGQCIRNLPMIGKREQGSLRHRVHRVWSRQRADVESVRSLWILRAGASPKQALGGSSFGRQLQPLRRSQQLAVSLI